MNAANGWNARFSPIGPSGTGGVEVVTDHGAMRMAPEGLAGTIAPVVGAGDNANTATYASVWPGIDLVYRVSSVAVKEELVVRATPKTSEFALMVEGADLRDGGTRADVSIDGALGQDLAIAPPEVLGKDGRSADRLAKPDYRVEDTGANRSRLVVTVDDTWAKGLTGAMLPVVVDPTVVVNASLLTAYRSDGTTVSDGNLRVGNPDTPTPTTWRSVAFYPYQTAIQNKQLLSATLNVTRVAGLTTVTTMGVYWANAWSHAGAKAGSALATAASVSSTASFDLTAFYQARQAQPSWNAALGVIGQETSSYTYKSLSSSVTFVTNNLPTMATASAPADGAVFTATTTPRLAVNAATDADGTPVQYWYRLTTGPDVESGMILNSGWLTSTTSWNVPAGVLQDGVTYYWHVHTWDGNWGFLTTQPTWVRSFTIDRRLGGAGASASETVGPVNVNLVNGNAAISTSTHQVASLGGDIGLDFTYNSLGSSQGLEASYYKDDGDRVFEASDPLVLARRDTQVFFNWALKAPSPSVPIDGFLTRWKGFITVPAGSWKLGERSDDGFLVKVDGATVINQWATGAAAGTPGNWTASAVTTGSHAIQVDFSESTGPATAELWAQNGTNPAIPVPASWLSVTPPALPDGWTLSTESATSDWASARIGDASVTLIGIDGSTTEFRHRGDLGSGTRPAGYDDTLTVNNDGSVTVTGEDGGVTLFGPDGVLRSVTSSVDGKRSAATLRTFNTAGQLTTLTDPVSTRSVSVTYAPRASCPTAAPDGTTSVPVVGMICKVSFFDDTTTDLHYSNSRLAWVVNPGGDTIGYGYDANGRVSQILSPLAADAIAASVRTGDPTAYTEIAYSGTKVATVTLPAPLAGAVRPQSSVAYVQTFNPAGNVNGELVSGTAPVTTAGQTGTHVVGYDGKGRVTADTDPTGRSTAYAWDSQDRIVATTGPDGLRSTTIFDAEGRPIENYGPSPSTWFGVDNKPTAPNVAATPVSTTRYDEGLLGLAVSWWDNIDQAGPPKLFEHLGAVGGLDLSWGTGGPVGLGVTATSPAGSPARSTSPPLPRTPTVSIVTIVPGCTSMTSSCSTPGAVRSATRPWWPTPPPPDGTGSASTTRSSPSAPTCALSGRPAPAPMPRWLQRACARASGSPPPGPTTREKPP